MTNRLLNLVPEKKKNDYDGYTSITSGNAFASFPAKNTLEKIK